MAVSRKTNEIPKGVNLDRLTKLAERWESKKSKADDARSDLGTIAKEVEDLGFNRAAFKLTMKLRNMEPEKRNDFTASLNAYCDHFGIWDTQPDLWNDAPSGIGPKNGAAPNEEARAAGREDGLGGVKDHAARYPQGEPGHADYELGKADGEAERARILEMGKPVGTEAATAH